MLYLTCTTITSIDLAHYGVSRAKDWVSVKCGTRMNYSFEKITFSLERISDSISLIFREKRGTNNNFSQIINLMLNFVSVPCLEWVTFCDCDGWMTCDFTSFS